MAVDIIISHPQLNGLHEAVAFVPSIIEELGITEWSKVGGSKRIYLDSENRVVQKGDIYVRPLVKGDGETADPGGGYTWFGKSADMKEGIRLNVRNLITTAPESNLRNPLGHPVFLPDGTRAVRPAVGQPDIDPWDGFTPREDENGDPILVTA